MAELKTGLQAPKFSLPDKDGNIISLNGFKDKWVVLYFYPKDNTPGCTIEAIDFTSSLKEFKKLNTVILGVSPDSPKSHLNFCNKHNLEVNLLSDQDHKTMENYGVWQLKNLFGIKHHGVVRSTFLIDPQGKISHIWRKVKVKGHIKEVKEVLINLKG